MPSLKSLLLGEEAFGNCSHVVFESEYIPRKGIMTRHA